jgi:hypothetical protein
MFFRHPAVALKIVVRKNKIVFDAQFQKAQTIANN